MPARTSVAVGFFSRTRSKIGAGDAGFDAAESVVAAECEHEDSDGLTENPIDTARATGGCFAAQSGVDDAPRGRGGLNFLPNEGGVSFSSGVVQTVARSKAVAEENDRAGLGGLGWGWRGGVTAGERQGAGEERESEETKGTGARGHAGFCVVRVFRGRLP